MYSVHVHVVWVVTTQIGRILSFNVIFQLHKILKSKIFFMKMTKWTF